MSFANFFGIYKRILKSRVVIVAIVFYIIGMLGSSIYEVVQAFSIIFDVPIGHVRTVMPVLVSLLSFGAIAFTYLQSGGGSNVNESSNDRNIFEKELRNQIELNRALIEKLEESEKASQANSFINEDEKKNLIDEVVKNTSDESIERIFDRKAYLFSEKLDKQLKNKNDAERLDDISLDIVSRIRREIRDLRLRTNVNLIIGGAITYTGLWLLWDTATLFNNSEIYTNLIVSDQISTSHFIKLISVSLGPRVLLVISIEVFAYFFLKLYKNGLEEIKYFQNELTNIESKVAAIHYGIYIERKEFLPEVLIEMAKTERNFILSKGQTTVELEKARSDSVLMNGLLKKFPLLMRLFKR